jgi:D-arabinose 1-dehydrogenase-like Zn-dependent alcohol dehydrogenase
VKAAVQRAINVVEVEDVLEAVTQPGQIEFKIAYAGICRTDIEINQAFEDQINGRVMKALVKP